MSTSPQVFEGSSQGNLKVVLVCQVTALRDERTGGWLDLIAFYIRSCLKQSVIFNGKSVYSTKVKCN